MDIRIERTLRSLQQAMLALTQEIPYDDITVSNIVERAGVNRSTFYQHYSDKDVLLADALDALALADNMKIPKLPAKLPLEPPPAIVEILQHYDTHADLYRIALVTNHSPAVTARILARFEAATIECIESSGTTAFDGIPADVVSAGVAGSVVSVIRSWLARDPRPSTQTAAEWIWGVLLAPGLPH